MDEKRLVPYSVHLPQNIYKQLKAAAGQRKASGMVRDAITMIIEGDDDLNAVYNKALRDAVDVIKDDEHATIIAVGGQSISDLLARKLEDMIVIQSTAKDLVNAQT
jgi:hypothetical protein